MIFLTHICIYVDRYIDNILDICLYIYNNNNFIDNLIQKVKTRLKY